MKKTILILGMILLLSLTTVLATECGSTPVGNCIITQDTTFTPGTYDMTGGDGRLWMNTSDVVLDCNGAILDGGGTSDAGILIQNGAGGYGGASLNIFNITVKNCNFQNYPDLVISASDDGEGYQDLYIYNNNITDSYLGIELDLVDGFQIYDNDCINVTETCIQIGTSINGYINHQDSSDGINLFNWNSQFYNITIDTELNNHTANLFSYVNFDVTAFYYDVVVDGYDVITILNVTDGQSFTKDTYFLHYKPWQYGSGYSFPNGLNIGANGITLDFRGGQDPWMMWGDTPVKIAGTGSNSGIRNNGYDNVLIKNAIITNYQKGIDIDNSDDVTVLENTVYNSEYGIEPDGTIRLSIINNTIIGSSNRGISLESGQTDMLIDGNNIHDSFLPIRVSGQWGDNLGVTIINNNVTNSTIQYIDIAQGTNNNIVVTDNYFTGSTGSANAVLFGDITNFTYTDNTMESPNLYVFGTNSNFEIYDSEFGDVSVEGTPTGLLNFTNNLITDNDVINSLSLAQSVGGKMLWTGTDGVTYNVTTPTNDYGLTQNTLLTDGVFNLPDGVTFSDIDNIELHCRGQTLNGTGSNVGVQTWKENLTIRNCVINNYGDGIRGSKWSNQLTIHDNSFSGQTNNGDIFANAPDDYGGDNMHIYNNSFTSNILFEGGIFSNNVLIEDNTGDVDIQTFGDNNMIIRNNDFNGIYVGGTDNAIIYGNIFDKEGEDAVTIDGVTSTNFYNNSVTGRLNIGGSDLVSGLVIEDNNIDVGTDWSFFRCVKDVRIENNDYTSTGYFIILNTCGLDTRNITIQNNDFNQAPLSLGWFGTSGLYDDITITNNDLHWILIVEDYNATVTDNNISGMIFIPDADPIGIDLCGGGTGNTYLDNWQFGSTNGGQSYIFDNACPSLTIPNGLVIGGGSPNTWEIDSNDVVISGSGNYGINVTSSNDSIIENFNLTGFTNSLVFESASNNNKFVNSSVEKLPINLGLNNVVSRLDVLGLDEVVVTPGYDTNITEDVVFVEGVYEANETTVVSTDGVSIDGGGALLLGESLTITANDVVITDMTIVNPMTVTGDDVIVNNVNVTYANYSAFQDQGETTELSIVENISSVDLVLDNGVAKLVFNEPVDLTEGGDLDAYVDVAHNEITVESGTSLDLPATLTFKDTGFRSINNILIMKDGSSCDDCSNLHITSVDDVNVDVTGFSTYVVIGADISQENYETMRGNFLYILAAFATVVIIIAATLIMIFVTGGKFDLVLVAGAVLALAVGFAVLLAVFVSIMNLFG